jgi:hypothetical protein
LARRGQSVQISHGKWESLTVPREFGGMGIINTRRMNDCLLAKWIWKIVNREDSMWCRLMTKKYMGDKDFFSTRSQGGSQFWRGLHKVKHLFKWRAMNKVGNGRKTKF